MGNTVYIRMRNRIEVQPNAVITLGDISRVVSYPDLELALKNLVLYRVNMTDKNLIVIDIAKVIAKVQESYQDLEIQPLGPSQTIIEVLYSKNKYQPAFIVFVWLLLFIGSAVAIMNFHEDVSMKEVHQKIYTLITGEKNEHPLVLQIPYSFGLGLGMILFFNHLIRKRINEEPSPMEVEIFNYQQAVDQYVMMHENKESMKKIDDN
ncbi:stage V sporulation protein AA [Bacillus sp. HMF5848]|uniref:stage V sporulation protein AA n=1 Tax=Bacillus sp. HMF5848 TaxID=2495421 RepID=UPI000F786EA4|nr:stage V sporulation protein AA [Bacillus sp. HMF5848]RSK27707.1 stage V sporulation protein AA [Bacillus sp. HMF5848]